MDVSKIQLSSAEMELVLNAGIILTKNRVLSKVHALLDEVQQKQLSYIGLNLKNEICAVPPKISKGENYEGLPYLILDYPRLSSSNNLFFIRSMFWWGNFFSSTLHLSGNAKMKFKNNIAQSYGQLQKYFIGISEDPWRHHFEKNNYSRIGSITSTEFHEHCEKFDHIKIAAKYPLSEWDQASSKLYEDWKFFLSVCRLVP